MKNAFLFLVFLKLSSVSYAKAPIIGGEIVPAGHGNGIFNFFTTDENGDISDSCTASKIGKKYILTAAHCLYGKNLNTIGWTNSGEVDLSDENTTLYGLYIKKINIHPSYELYKMLGQTFKSNDVAIIEVDTERGNYLDKFNEMPSLELDFSPVVSGEKLKTYGYGCEATADLDNPVSHKKNSDIETLPFSALNTSCSSIAPVINHSASSIYKSQMISASLRSGGKSSLCEGDSGGPVTRNGKVVGVNSQYLIDQTSQTEEAYLNLHSRLSEIRGWADSILK
jgi:secreted trypsin-like serine protease